MSSAICFNLDQFKILSSGNGLNMPPLCRREHVLLVGLHDNYIQILYGHISYNEDDPY